MKTEYDYMVAETIQGLVKYKTRTFLDGKEHPDILEGYLDSMPNCIYGSFRQWTLEQLENMVEIRFIADGAGHVEFFFKWGLDITDDLKDMRIVPTKAGLIKLIAYHRWVDRY